MIRQTDGPSDERGTTEPLEPRPVAGASWRDERACVLGVITELSGERDPVARAELAVELLQRTAALLDTDNRALVDFLLEHDRSEAAARLEGAIERVREALEPIHAATHRSAPIEVHQSDPEGFEADLERLVQAIQEYLDSEWAELVAIEAYLPREASAALGDQRDAAARAAIPAVRPARSGIGRAWSRVAAALDHRPDTGTAYRPVQERRARGDRPDARRRR